MADLNPVRELADLTKIVIDTSNVLGARGGELLDMLIERLPGAPGPLTIDASEDTSDPTHMTVLLAWNNSGGGHVMIDWGVPDVVDDDEPSTGTKSYRYLVPGEFTITVTDVGDPTRTASVDVAVPFMAALELVALENTTDATRMTANVTADNHGRGTVTLEFGDATPSIGNPGDGTTATPHAYASPGTYTVKATDSSDPTRIASTAVTVPFTTAP